MFDVTPRLYASPWLLNWLIISICVLLGIVTFTTPFLFDEVSILIFTIIIIFFRQNENIVGLGLILIVAKVTILLLYFSLTNNAYLQSIFFIVSSVAIGWTHTDKINRIIIPIFVTAIAAQIYWQITDFKSPMIYFFFLKISIYLMIRSAIVYRPHFQVKHGKPNADYIRGDWLIHKAIAVVCVIDCLMVIEYLIRAFTDSDALYLYNSYEYFVQGFGVWVMWVLLREAKEQFEKDSISA